MKNDGEVVRVTGSDTIKNVAVPCTSRALEIPELNDCYRGVGGTDTIS